MRVAVSGNLVPLLATFCGGRDEEELEAACAAAAHVGPDAINAAGIGEDAHRDLSVSLKLYVGSGRELPGGVAAALRAVLDALRLEYADVVLLDSEDLHEPGEGTQLGLRAWEELQQLAIETQLVRNAGLGRVHPELLKQVLASARVPVYAVEVDPGTEPEVRAQCARANVSVFARPDMDACVQVLSYAADQLRKEAVSEECAVVVRYVSVVHCRNFVRHLGYAFVLVEKKTLHEQ
jgi:diketogulonate reductase-like aldo/keto reductase